MGRTFDGRADARKKFNTENFKHLAGLTKEGGRFFVASTPGLKRSLEYV